MVEDRPIMSVNIISQFQSSMLGIANPLCSDLSAIAERLVTFQIIMCMFCTSQVFVSSFLLCCNASAFVICAIKNYFVTYLLTYLLFVHKKNYILLIFCQNAASLQTLI